MLLRSSLSPGQTIVTGSKHAFISQRKNTRASRYERIDTTYIQSRLHPGTSVVSRIVKAVLRCSCKNNVIGSNQRIDEVTHPQAFPINPIVSGSEKAVTAGKDIRSLCLETVDLIPM